MRRNAIYTEALLALALAGTLPVRRRRAAPPPPPPPASEPTDPSHVAALREKQRQKRLRRARAAGHPAAPEGSA